MPTRATELTVNVADIVRALCALRGIMHRELARGSGLPEPTVSRWCTPMALGGDAPAGDA